MKQMISHLGWLAPALVAGAVYLGPAEARAGTPEAEDSPLNDPERPVALRLNGELGFLGVIDHKLQLGSDGSYVDLRNEMAQDTLFVFGRLSADLDIGKKRRHTVTMLYQPLNLETSAVVERDIQVEDVTYAAGTPLDFRYGFSFWRGSYLFDFLKDDREVGIGLAVQIRNARIQYSAQDGTSFRGVRDIGPVPLLKFRGRGYVYRNLWLGGEVDGFYAPIRYINGGNSDVEGAIVDASFRAGLSWRHGVDTFLNLRYLGGGAQGTSSDPDAFSDGFNRNWLHFMTVSIGVSLR